MFQISELEFKIIITSYLFKFQLNSNEHTYTHNSIKRNLISNKHVTQT